MATASMASVAALATAAGADVAGAFWMVACGLGLTTAVSAHRHRRMSRALRGHPWRRVTFAPADWRGWSRSPECDPPQRFELPAAMSGADVWVAGPVTGTRWQSTWSAVHADESDEVHLVAGPRPPDWRLSRALRRRSGDRSLSPPRFHDIAPTPCSLGTDGVTRDDESSPSQRSEMLAVAIRRWWHTADSQVFLNGGERIGQIAIDGSRVGLLDRDGRLVVYLERRFGIDFFSTTRGPLAYREREDLALHDLTLRYRTVRSRRVFESSDGTVLGTGAVIRKTRTETVALITVSCTLEPMQRAVVLLQAAALLQKPASPASG
jgi:hypothetical protein